MIDLRQEILASLRADDVAALGDGALVALAHRLQPYLIGTTPAAEPDGWLDFDGALEHLGMKRGTLYKLTSARTIPFHQDGPGCKLWFLRSELDDWRRHRGARRSRPSHLRVA
ncbi:MAG: helix-turn-helix transcriptional regulator [Solirubrobacteraceae bacterium]